MGGKCIIDIIKNNENDLSNGKIKKIAFLDSAHGETYKLLSNEGKLYLRYISKDFIKNIFLFSFSGFKFNLLISLFNCSLILVKKLNE